MMLLLHVLFVTRKSRYSFKEVDILQTFLLCIASLLTPASEHFFSYASQQELFPFLQYICHTKIELQWQLNIQAFYTFIWLNMIMTWYRYRKAHALASHWFSVHTPTMVFYWNYTELSNSDWTFMLYSICYYYHWIYSVYCWIHFTFSW